MTVVENVAEEFEYGAPSHVGRHAVMVQLQIFVIGLQIRQQLTVILSSFFNVRVQIPMLMVKIVFLLLHLFFAASLFGLQSALLIIKVANVAWKVIKDKMVFLDHVGFRTNKAAMLKGDV